MILVPLKTSYNSPVPGSPSTVADLISGALDASAFDRILSLSRRKYRQTHFIGISKLQNGSHSPNFGARVS